LNLLKTLLFNSTGGIKMTLFLCAKLNKMIKFAVPASLLLAIATVATPGSAQSKRQPTATYEVPQGALLPEPLIVPIKKARLSIEGGIAELDYKFPQELDGDDPKRLFLKGTFDEIKSEWNLTTEGVGQNTVAATATCVGDAKDFTCTMTYAKEADDLFHLNIEAADAYLRTRTDLTPAQITHIKDAQVALSHEPIGIIRVRR
jgi:hypothetical protein